MKKLSILLLVLISCATDEQRSLAPEAFRQKMETTPHAVILDVRTKEEVDNGYIAGAINIDYNAGDFRNGIALLDKDKTYFVYCGSGVRSSKAVELMNELGFKKYYTLDGGMKEWKAKNMEVVQK
jgi:rhodanese-related sulfurtransferase